MRFGNIIPHSGNRQPDFPDIRFAAGEGFFPRLDRIAVMFRQVHHFSPGANEENLVDSGEALVPGPRQKAKSDGEYLARQRYGFAKRSRRRGAERFT
jgi:hypothetical protein